MKKLIALLCCFCFFSLLFSEEISEENFPFSLSQNGSLAKQNTQWGNMYVFYDKNGLYCTIEKFDSVVIQKKYTDSLLLAEEHRYKTQDETYEPFYMVAYFYENDFLQRKCIADNEKKLIENYVYDNSSKLIQESFYAIEEKILPTEFSVLALENLSLQSQTNWKYEKDFLKEINEQKQDISYRTVYEKTAFNTINEFFYKNEELYQKKIFLSADSYEVFVYFSKDYWVVSLYEKDLKKSDAYYLNGNLTRKKDFEVSP
ncbi:MAG: hypothetical protein E7062_07880 [Spirochaetaceae bacterium]|nr:hypothetical protein [Spirochaetaceae bacterium]